MYLEINDYEILYLIGEGNEKALSLLFEKYKPVIYRIIAKFHITGMEREEFLQEGYMILQSAVDSFNPNYNKTFYKYFECILIRRYQALVKSYYKYSYFEHTGYDENICHSYLKENTLFEDVFEELSSEERKLLAAMLEPGFKPVGYSEVTKIPIKKVYNDIYRLKNKLREILSKS